MFQEIVQSIAPLFEVSNEFGDAGQQSSIVTLLLFYHVGKTFLTRYVCWGSLWDDKEPAALERFQVIPDVARLHGRWWTVTEVT